MYTVCKAILVLIPRSLITESYHFSAVGDSYSTADLIPSLILCCLSASIMDNLYYSKIISCHSHNNEYYSAISSVYLIHEAVMSYKNVWHVTNT